MNLNWFETIWSCKIWQTQVKKKYLKAPYRWENRLEFTQVLSPIAMKFPIIWFFPGGCLKITNIISKMNTNKHFCSLIPVYSYMLRINLLITEKITVTAPFTFIRSTGTVRKEKENIDNKLNKILWNCRIKRNTKWIQTTTTKAIQ